MKPFEAWIQRAIAWVFRLLHLPLGDDMLQTLTQFIKFGIVGVSNTVVSYVVNVAVLTLLKPYGLSWDYVAGNLVAFALSVLWSYHWNSRYVFTADGDKPRNGALTLLKTYVSYGFTGILLTNVLSYVWINVFGISKYVAPLINLVVSIPLNFVINKLWAFKSPAPGDEKHSR